MAFRKIFGNENKKGILISFLNNILEFTKKVKDLKNIKDKWIYFVKNAGNMKMIPKRMQEPKELLEAFESARQMKWKKEELEAYDARGIYILKKEEIEKL